MNINLLSVVVFREGESIVAHGLDMDICAQGSNAREAVMGLASIVDAMSKREGKDYPAAPDDLFDKLANSVYCEDLSILFSDEVAGITNPQVFISL